MTRWTLQTFRGRNAVLNLFELWVGLAGMVSCAYYLISPDELKRASISIVVGPHLAAVWSIVYGVAGLLIWIGLLWPSPRWEVCGLSLLGSATGTYGTAILWVAGQHGLSASITFLTLAIASWGRAALVMERALKFARERGRSVGARSH